MDTDKPPAEPPLTAEERARLEYYLCDPFLTYHEALSLAGIKPPATDKPQKPLAA